MNKVHRICYAYEQGVGKGRQDNSNKMTNPYCYTCEDEHEAWNYGYSEGQKWIKSYNKAMDKHSEWSDFQ